MTERTLKSLVVFLFFGTLTLPNSAFAQNYDQVETIFRCESIDQLIQTFEWSGTRSTVLQSMMTSIQSENLNSGFERQIINELQKKPWRLSTIKELEAEFQVIRGQYNADLIGEADARLRMACELAKYLHRDYLENFDRASIFSTQSVPFAFYTYVRENRLWQNLTNPDLDVEEVVVPEQTTPTETEEDLIDGGIDPGSTNQNGSRIDLLTFLYWLFLILIGWIILALITGYLLKHQRFTNPITQRVFEVLLWPYKLIEPLLTSRPSGEKKFHGLSQRAYGNPLSEDQLRLLIDNRIAETEKKVEEPTSDANPTAERMNALEAQLAKLEREQHDSENNPVTPNPDLVSLQQVFIALEAKVESLHQKIDQLSQQIEEGKSSEKTQISGNGLNTDELEKIKMAFREELEDYKQDIDEQLLQITTVMASQPEEEETDNDNDQSEESTVQSNDVTESPGLDLEIDEPEEESIEEEEEPEEIEPSVAAPEQLELTPLPAEDRPQQFIYYASSPQRGIFYGKRLESGFIPKQTVYKIMVDKENPNHATFTMVTHEPTIRLALNILDSYVLPAMDLEGPGELEDATDIGPVEPGELKKEGEDWYIVKKGVLHFR